MRFVAAAAAVLIATSATAQSRCPTSPDLENGVILRDTSQNFALEYSRLPDGLIAERRFGAGDTTGDALMSPHLLTKAVGASSAPVSFSADVADLDRLDQTLTWVSQAFVSVGGVDIPNGMITAQYAHTTTYEIGNCRYQIWVVDVTQTSSLGTTHTRNHYAPELGLILTVQRLDEGGTVISELVFNEVQIVPN